MIFRLFRIWTFVQSALSNGIHTNVSLILMFWWWKFSFEEDKLFSDSRICGSNSRPSSVITKNCTLWSKWAYDFYAVDWKSAGTLNLLHWFHLPIEFVSESNLSSQRFHYIFIDLSSKHSSHLTNAIKPSIRTVWKRKFSKKTKKITRLFLNQTKYHQKKNYKTYQRWII